MSAPIAVRASYSDFKILKTRSVFQIILEAPIEQAEDFVTAFGLPIPGSERPVALALLNPSSTPSEQAGTTARDLRPAEPRPVEVTVREAPEAEGPGRPIILADGEPLTSRNQAEGAGRTASNTSTGRPRREPPCPTAAPDRLLQYVSIACGDPTFQKWLKGYVDLAGDLDHQSAAHCVRQLLGVKSRAEISTDEVARQKALDLMGAYEIATGKHAEDRG